MACDAHVILSVEAPDGSILDQGRVRRDPTVAQRIEIARRDKGCRFPGCTFTEFTDVHHVQHWVHGGATDLDNLVTLCGRHHRAVHELGWVMKGNANTVLSFTSPHGRIMRSVPSPTWPRILAGPRRSRWAAAALTEVGSSAQSSEMPVSYFVAPTAPVTSWSNGLTAGHIPASPVSGGDAAGSACRRRHSDALAAMEAVSSRPAK